MKKTLALILVLLLSLTLFACDPSGNNEGGEENGEETYDVVMVTDIGSIDDGSFNQGTWEGIVRYCQENNITHTYLRPLEQTTDGYLSSIEQAISMGAKIVLCPGFLFEPAIFQAQDLYPEVKFVLIDGRPNDGVEWRTNDNVYAINFAEQETGFLAGYAAVKEGFRSLGFFAGMGVPAVQRFGYGFVEGAEYAAMELGLAPGEIDMKYWYSGDFEPSPAKLTAVTGWYETGTEIIFSCGGTIVENAIAAAESLDNKWVVGVDVDQGHMSERIITSSMKNLGNVAYTQLDLFFKDEFVGGDYTLGVVENMVSLPNDFSRFTTFTQADYDAIYATLVADEGGVRTGLYTDATAADPTEIPLTYVTLEYIV